MLYKSRLPLHLQPLRQPEHEQYTRTRMLELRDYETRNTLSVFDLCSFRVRSWFLSCLWLSSVAQSCATWDESNEDNVCTPTYRPAGINRPPHLRPFRIYPECRTTKHATRCTTPNLGARNFHFAQGNIIFLVALSRRIVTTYHGIFYVCMGCYCVLRIIDRSGLNHTNTQ